MRYVNLVFAIVFFPMAFFWFVAWWYDVPPPQSITLTLSMFVFAAAIQALADFLKGGD
jgi:hypothetical protein